MTIWGGFLSTWSFIEDLLDIHTYCNFSKGAISLSWCHPDRDAPVILRFLYRHAISFIESTGAYFPSDRISIVQLWPINYIRTLSAALISHLIRSLPRENVIKIWAKINSVFIYFPSKVTAMAPLYCYLWPWNQKFANCFAPPRHEHHPSCEASLPP